MPDAPAVPNDLFVPSTPLREDTKRTLEGMRELSKLMHPVVPRNAFITYWQFAAERQEIFFRRHAGSPPPWTQDSILHGHRFTNVYRVTDRVSQYLIRQVQYSESWSNDDLLFRTLLFKIFNRISTWNRLVAELGEPKWRTFSIATYGDVLNQMIDEGERVYSAAYIMPSGSGPTRFSRKHLMHLNLLEFILKNKGAEKLAAAKSMEAAFEILLAYPTFGPFLAYQYAIDINYSTLTNFNEMQFVVPGPGAKEGIAKCFSDTAHKSASWIIQRVTEIQSEAFSALKLHFRPLANRALQLIDCQNIFCELGKYARVRHPELNEENGRSRIKQKFVPHAEPIQYMFPPKWGISALK